MQNLIWTYCGALFLAAILTGCVDVPSYDLAVADGLIVVAADVPIQLDTAELDAGDGPLPDVSAVPDARMPDAITPDVALPDAGCEALDLGVCAECVAGQVVMPETDELCVAVCPADPTFERREQVCIAFESTPNNACLTLGACADDPAQGCAIEESIAGDGTDVCRTLQGCEGAVGPSFEFGQERSRCNRFGECRADGFCSVSNACAFDGENRVERLCFDELREGQHVCEVYFDGNGTPCNQLCASQGMACVTAYGARNDCDREEERGCDISNSDIICVCAADGLPPPQ